MRIRFRFLSLVALVILALPPLACAGGDASAGDVEVVRRDSAGVAIVENRGGDVPLGWTFEEVLRLGGADEGPEAFYRPVVGADRHGRIYVLDAGEHRVSVFDSTGALVRTFGSKGGGPGELERPAQLAVTDDGTVGVQDYGKGAIVRWDSAGRVLEQIRLAEPMLWDLQSAGGELAGEFVRMSGFGEDADSVRHRLMPITAAGDSTVLASLAAAPGREADFGCVKISSMSQLFQPELPWTAAAGRFVVATGSSYDLELRDATGALTGIVRRDVAPEPATDALAATEVGDSMRVSFGGGGGCAIPQEKVVEVRGYAPVVPAVRRLHAMPGGGWWAARGVGQQLDDRSYDVFDRDGAYLGTLPLGTPRPHAFLADDLLVTVEKDDVDLPYVVVYRIGRE